MAGEPPAPRERERVRANLTVLSLRALLVGLRGTVLAVVLQPFVLQLGASVAYLGLLETVGGYRGAVPTLVLPVGGWLADRVGRKAVTILSGGLTMIGLLGLALAGRVQAAALLLPAMVLLGFGGLGRPASDALVGESARSQRVGRAYGQVTFAWALAGVIASLGAGILADSIGFSPVFALTAALEVVGILFLVFWVRETLVSRRQARFEWGEFRRLAAGVLVPPSHLRGLYAAVIADTFFYGVGTALLYGFLADRYGYTPFQFGVMTTVFSLGWVLAQLPAGRWVDQGRARELLVISELLNAVVIASWLVTSSLAVFVVSMAALGVVSALWSPALMGWVYVRIPEARRAEELGRLSAVPGVFAFPAPYIGGLLYVRFGFAAPIAINAAGALVAAGILTWGIGARRRS